MRLGVLDVGSNTVHLLVVDAHRGGHPDPAASVKTELRLAELLDDAGAITAEGVSRLTAAVASAARVAADHGTEDLVAFATSAVREAANGEAVLAAVRAATGVDLQVLPGADEARLTFLAVRRWFGWSAGQLLLLDIGGGSLEVARGRDEEPDYAQSLPLGAGRLFRAFLAAADPPQRGDVVALRQHVREQLAGLPRAGVAGGPGADVAVGTSKTFRSLARLGGAAPSAQGPRVPRLLHHGALTAAVPRLAQMTAEQRAALPGVSVGRAAQLLAGAVVADEVMAHLGVPVLQVCPWALREGVILRRLDWLAGL